MTKAKAAALAESNEEAVELRSRRFCGWQRNTQRLFFVGPSGERFRKKPEELKRAAGQTASFRSPLPLAELRGGSLLSGCRGETSGAGRGQGPVQLSDGNRHLVVGITCRHGFGFSGF